MPLLKARIDQGLACKLRFANLQILF